MFGKKDKNAPTPEKITELLEKVNDPVLEQNLVEAGMLKHIQVEKGRVRIGIELPTPAWEPKDLLEQEIHSALAEAVGLSKGQAGEAVDALLASISGHLAGGDRVQIPGFGTFQVSERAARTGRNPATGETIQIAASKSVRFKPGKALKDAVNG